MWPTKMLSHLRCCLPCYWRAHKAYSAALWCKRCSLHCSMTAFFNTYGFLITSMVLAAMLALSLYSPLMAGQLSLASPGFYALGGYIAAVMSTKYFPAPDGRFPIALML